MIQILCNFEAVLELCSLHFVDELNATGFTFTHFVQYGLFLILPVCSIILWPIQVYFTVHLINFFSAP